jgi:hypothetical protein
MSAAVSDTRATILVLLMVVLRGDMLRHLHKVGIRPLLWLAGYKQSAPLVIVSAKAVCT